MSEISNDNIQVRTVGDFLFGCVNFSVPDCAVEQVSDDRDIPLSTPKSKVPKNTLRLMKADLLKWIVLGPSRVNSTSDSDNGWSHSDGGYSLSDDDKKLLLEEANGIYEELEPESMFAKRKIRMRSAGIMPAYRDTDGTPLKRKPL